MVFRIAFSKQKVYDYLWGVCFMAELCLERFHANLSYKTQFT